MLLYFSVAAAKKKGLKPLKIALKTFQNVQLLIIGYFEFSK
jgi:hypothetical protein